MTIYEVIREQRRKLIARDRDSLLQVTRGFAIARREISKSLLDLLNQMADASSRGEKITENWLRKANRLHALKSQTAGAISRFSVGLELSVLNGQRAEVEQAVRDAAATYHAARSVNPRLPIEFDRLHDDAAQTMIGQLGDGSPLSRLIGQFPKQAAALAEEGLIQGIALGRNPRDTALRLQSAMSGGGQVPVGGPDEVFAAMRKIKTRSLAIARTETLRAYRSSSLATYEANPDVVTGWIWLATLDTRTCASCWAMHGTKHPATEVFGSHVNCRCSPAPDIEGVDLEIRTGEERFALLDSEKQQEILGANKFELYREKKIALADAVAYSEDKNWGPQRVVANADRALHNSKRRLFSVGGSSGGSPPPTPPPIAISPPWKSPLVSSSVILPKSGIARPVMVEALNLVDAVHADGALPTTRVTARGRFRALGEYVPSTRTNRGGPRIILNTSGSDMEFTAVHELGHLIEVEAFGKGYSVVATDPRFQGFISAFAGTPEIQKLIQELDDVLKQLRLGRQLTQDGINYFKHLEYLLRTPEIWARAYAQYVAMKTQDAKLMGALGRVLNLQRQGILPGQWEHKNFMGIMDAIDDLFKSEGWFDVK